MTDRSSWTFDLERWVEGEMPVTRQNEYKVLALHRCPVDDLLYGIFQGSDNRLWHYVWYLNGLTSSKPKVGGLDLVHPPRTKKVRTVWYRGPNNSSIRATDVPMDFVLSTGDIILKDKIMEVPV